MLHVVSNLDEILWKLYQRLHTGEISKHVRFLKHHENVPGHIIFVINTGNKTVTEKGHLVIYQRVYTGNENQWQHFV